jgi:hypothetical protein
MFVKCLEFASRKEAKRWNLDMTAAIGFGAHGRGHPTTDGIASQVRAYDAMARKVSEHALPIPEEGIQREDCPKLCLSIDAVKAAEKIAVDLSTGVVTGLTRVVVLSRDTCAEFRAGPSKFDEWAWTRKAEKAVAPTASSLRRIRLRADLPECRCPRST